MRRLFFAGALLILCVLPLALRGVDARARAARGKAQAGSSSGSSSAVSSGTTRTTGSSSAQDPIVRTLARDVVAGGLATDDSGRIYFTADDQVFRLTGDVRIAAGGRATPNGGLESAAGTGQRGFTGDGGPAIAAQFNLAASGGNLTADPSGSLFIADTLNDTVRRVDAESQLISSVAGRWSTGAAVTSRDVVRPALVATDASGNLFGTGNNILWRLDTAGTLTQIATVSNPRGLAVSRDGATIAVVAGGGELLIVFRRTGAAHYGMAFTYPMASDAAMAVDRGDGPRVVKGHTYGGLAIGASGDIFMADSAANIIFRLDSTTLKVEAFAGNGHAGYSGDGGAPLGAEFNAPGALAIDRDGDLLIADTGNRAIREVTHAAAVAGVTLSPNTFTFPNEPIGGASAAQAFTLTNNSAVQVTGITISIEDSSNPPDFTQTSDCASILASGASCTINVVFVPQVAGNRSGALHVTDSDPSSPQTAALAGFADDFELQLQSGNTDTLTVIAGAEGNYNLAVVPDDNFSGSVTIQCPVGLPADTTCGIATGTASSSSGLPSGTLGPSSLAISVTPGAPQNFVVTLVTQAKGQITSTVPPRKWPRFPAPGVLVLSMASIALLGAWGWRRGFATHRRLGTATFAAVALLAISFASACGGSSNTTTIITKPNPGTPAGTTKLNVIGNSQGASRAFTITLIVEA